MKKIFGTLASPKLMALVMFLVAFAAGFATFIENDYGSQAARSMVYNTRWFELLFALLAINLLLSVFHNRLYIRGKLPVFLFHISFVVIILGAAVTRYFSVEGTMHIREGKTASTFQSSYRWLTIAADGEVFYSKKANYTVLSANSFSKRHDANGKSFTVSLKGFIPNATEKILEDSGGQPMVSLMVIDTLGGRSLMVNRGKSVWVGGRLVGFESQTPADLQVHRADSGLVAIASSPVETNAMSTGTVRMYQPGEPFPLKQQTIYLMNGLRIAFSGFSPSARRVWAYNPDPNAHGRDVLLFHIEAEDGIHEVFVPRADGEREKFTLQVSGVEFSFVYNNPIVQLPFGIRLNRFELERYPGSESPSSFTSHVTVVDAERAAEKPFSIFMNNILSYRGYRFCQSSYDPDEKGTFLSVNSDVLGTTITYLGYMLMIAGMLLALVLPGTRFRMLLSKRVVALAFLLFVSAVAYGHTGHSDSRPVSVQRQHAREFGRLVVQDKGGRMKPLSTLAGEVLRKLNRSNSFEGLSPEQVYLSMSAFPDRWQEVAVIPVKNDELRRLLGISGDKAAFINFFDYEKGGKYKLKNHVQWASSEPPSSRTAFQKEVIKADERVNILYQIFSGQLARIFPVANCEHNKWQNMADAVNSPDSAVYAQTASVYARYLTEVRSANRSGDYSKPDMLLGQLVGYQADHGGSILPPEGKVRAELLLNRYLIYERLISFYGILGFLLILVSLMQVLGAKGTRFGRISIPVTCLLALGFIAHTAAIALRWYVAGRAPLSNGFETIIYIAWTAMLAGLLFNRRNRMVLPATALLATVILFVAHLSWMDPEITNLVPALKSCWLTMHVAVVTASYGFLGMGAILALFNLILFVVSKPALATRVVEQTRETTRVVEAVLIIGLYLLTIGSFLGAVWANESWGRYWGWDPKETWALITILVYTFVTHMRKIPGLGSLYVFNFASALGISSVLMTYFGVNYYLSGLHSYAGGEAAPASWWVALAMLVFFSLSLLAWYRYSRHVSKNMEPTEHLN